MCPRVCARMCACVRVHVRVCTPAGSRRALLRVVMGSSAKWSPPRCAAGSSAGRPSLSPRRPRRGGSVSVPPARPASGWSPSSRRRVCGGSLWSAIISERPGSSAPVSAPRAPRRAADLLRRRRRVPLGQGRRREVGLAGSPHPVASDGPHVLAAAPRPTDCAVGTSLPPAAGPPTAARPLC